VVACKRKRKPRHELTSTGRPDAAAIGPAVAPASPAGSSSPGAGAGPASDPFAGQRLYVEPNSSADQTAQEWAQQGKAGEAAEIGKIGSQPVAKWFGDWSYGHGSTAGDVSWWVGEAAAAGAMAVLVAYDIPWRDCGQYSSGGAPSAQAYRQFIDEMAQGIGGRRAAVIVEPDALAELSCLSAEQQATYYGLLNYAVAELGASPNTAVYLDAGNAGWQPAGTMVTRLAAAGVSKARGFSLNVSNFDTTSSETSYGEAIAAGLNDGSHFVIDTSRNGRGPASGGEWCNPPGRGLGTPPTGQTGNSLTDAFLWIKSPGQSDGTCNGGPAAGEWWPAYALELARNAAG
jgi:endoglucanase